MPDRRKSPPRPDTRKWERHPLDREFRIFEVSDAGQFVREQTAFGRNISRGGMCLLVAETIAAGTLIVVTPHHPAPGEREETFFANVRRCTPSGEWSKIGIQFTKPPARLIAADWLVERLAAHRRAA